MHVTRVRYVPLMSTTVQTTAGHVRGAEHDGVLSFLGIPYAAPPVGTLRFRAPQPHSGWDGERAALEYGPSCPQPGGRPAGWSQEPSEDEDCLYLNVWTPSTVGTDRPVMVWIHGGGYVIGSGSWPLYQGERLARRGDAVVITLNHRLGVFGYLHSPKHGVNGNNGMLDLVAALEWVRDNAAAFGGDAGNVMVFGESGGGAKISTLLAMPAAGGLFHRAVIQSGPGLSCVPAERAAAYARDALAAAGIEDPRAASTEELLQATAAGGLMAFGPVLDGEHAPQHPGVAMAEGSAIDVPVIIGVNQDEFGTDDAIDDAKLRRRLAALREDRVEEIITTYRSMFPGCTNAQLLRWATADATFRAGSIKLAEQCWAGGMAAPLYQYFFTYEIQGLAAHGYEIAFCFDNVVAPTMAPSDTRQRLADEMSEAWLAFARTGDPNHPGLAEWPPYTPDQRATMVFRRDGSVAVDDPSGEARRLWSAYPPTSFLPGL